MRGQASSRLGHNSPVSTTFPRTRKSRLGYNIEQVEDFLYEAKRAYTAERGELVVIDANSVRQVAFRMQKGGYSPVHVDAALERLEDAFAARERERAFQSIGQTAWYSETRRMRREIVERLSRPAGQRFDRVHPLAVGYRRKEVDRLAGYLSKILADDRPANVDELRMATFRPQHGGYREAQVDLLIDSAVAVILAVR